MRRLSAWLAGVAGGAAAYRVFKRGPRTVTEPGGRADELRTKLAEARRAGDDRAAFESGETPVDEVDVAITDDLEARRRSVHEQGRAAIDEMQGD